MKLEGIFIPVVSGVEIRRKKSKVVHKITGVLWQRGAIKCNRSYNNLFLTDFEFSQEIFACLYINGCA